MLQYQVAAVAAAVGIEPGGGAGFDAKGKETGMKKIPVEESVGQVLGHDIVRIVPGQKKYRAFKRGHVIQESDLKLLREIGRENIFIWEPDAGMVHEDDAAERLARAAAGIGLELSEVAMGRVNLLAAHKGLLKVDVPLLLELNSLDQIIFSTLHNDRRVERGQKVAGTRVVPLAAPEQLIGQAEAICAARPLIRVEPYRPLWVAVITTGSEVNSGAIRDGFARVIREKINYYGGRWLHQSIVPDDADIIAAEINNAVNQGADLILATGGMSVDADDATPAGIRRCHIQEVFYGVPVLPGSQFLMAYLGHVPIIGVPGGALFNKVTTLDLLLPHIFAGETITRADMIALGHGGLCEECEVCRFPSCGFGK